MCARSRDASAIVVRLRPLTDIPPLFQQRTGRRLVCSRRACCGTAVIFYSGLVLRARALVRAVVLVVDRIWVARRARRLPVDDLPREPRGSDEGGTQPVRRPSSAPLAEASGFEAVRSAQHVEWSRAAAAVPDSTRRLYNSIAQPVSHCSTLTPCSASSASVSGHVFSRNCRPRLSTTTSGL
jgi:hypothetical protein